MPTLTPGARLGAYEILGPLGAGGMGEVYRARDTKLGRDVALKALPEAFTKDAERVARFQREAQLLAALNHPHIGAIYGLEEAQGAQLLVLELVEGDTLAERLKGGRALPVDEALGIARQIADALEAAHEKGIVHRDLKPANVVVTLDGTVKILDFGLAKAVGEGSRSGMQGDQSPTLTFAATQAGVILGTAAYMSPEQARGRPTDKRTDVWAFGCVLFEMLSGRRAFDGDDVTEIVASVVKSEPDWTKLPADVPAQLQTLIRRCLDKERRTRVSDIGVAKFLMSETIAAPAIAAPAPVGRQTSTPTAHDGRKHLALGAAFGLIVGAAAAVVIVAITPRSAPAPRTQQAVRFSIVPPPGQMLSLFGLWHHLAISPDGAHVVYATVGEAKGGAQSIAALTVRAIGELDARVLDGATGREPFISPDNQWIGYYDFKQLRKVPIGGGTPTTICPLTANSLRGASWGDDGNIVFAQTDSVGGLLSVSASDCQPKQLTSAEAAKAEQFHAFPFVLPGSRYIVFTIAAASVENSQIAVLDRQTGQTKVVLRGAADAKYIDGGYLVYATAGTIRAVRFDLSKLEVGGDPLTLAEHVQSEVTGLTNFAVSRTGALVYLPGATTTPLVPVRSLVWVDRQGREEPINAPQRPYAVPRLSPDGTRVAIDIRDESNDIWILDLGRQTLTPVNANPAADMSPVWTPDGRRVIWTSTRDGNPSVYWQAADGSGTPQRITGSVAAQFPTSISPDGTKIVVHAVAGSAMDVSVVSLDEKARVDSNGLRPLVPLLTGPAVKLNGEISPDGHWIANQSTESGQPQIYVRPFPNVNDGRYLISSDGGTRPAWSRDGKELFYLDANELLTSVPVQATATTFHTRPADTTAQHAVLRRVVDTRHRPPRLRRVARRASVPDDQGEFRRLADGRHDAPEHHRHAERDRSAGGSRAVTKR